MHFSEEKGFDFLGYHFSDKGLAIAEIAWKKFTARCHWLYEQIKTHPHRDALLGDYVMRWLRWTRVGLNDQENRRGLTS